MNKTLIDSIINYTNVCAYYSTAILKNLNQSKRTVDSTIWADKLKNLDEKKIKYLIVIVILLFLLLFCLLLLLLYLPSGMGRLGEPPTSNSTYYLPK